MTITIGSSLTVNGSARTIAEWLTWRKEVAQGEKNFLNSMSNGIKQIRDKIQREGKTLLTAVNEGSAQPGDAIISIEEKELASQLESMEITLGELDGKLSLANATTSIEV